MTRLRRLLVLTAVVTATLALFGPRVNAAPDGTVETNVFFRDLTVPADGPTVSEGLTVFLTSDRGGWADKVTVVVDTSAVAAVADVTVDMSDEGECSTAGPVVSCTLAGPHRIIDVPDSGTFSFSVVSSASIGFTPKPGAVPGAAGTLTITGRADDEPVTTVTSTVRIGEGVNLTAVDQAARTVAPGDTVALRPQVRNSGARAVDGLTLMLSADEEILADTDFGNCTYGFVVACTFDTTLAPGRAYRVSAPFEVGVPRDAAVGSEAGMGVQWLTRAEWQDFRSMWGGEQPGRRGAGPDLELSELASAAGVPQADIDGDDNGTYSRVTVTGGRRPDVVAVGATVAGPAGAIRTIDVGLVNRGPGTLRYPPFSNNLPWAEVTFPPGVSVVRADERCSSPFDDDPAGPPPSSEAPPDFGTSPYFCRPDTVRLRPGQRLSYAFTVRVAAGARDGKGAVDVAMFDGEDGVDRDAGNNSAAITLSVDGGAGGGLPVTGSASGMMAASGALLLAVGVAGVVLVRRRRVRFTA